MSIARLLSLLAIGSTFVLTSSVSLADTKFYGGVACYRDPDHAANATAADVTYFGGSIGNKSTTNFLSVICPLVHDEGHMSSATVFAFDRHSTNQVVCAIFEDIYGGSGGTPLTWSSNSNGSGLPLNQPHATSFSISGVTGMTGSASYAKCDIPPVGTGGTSHLGKIDAVEM